MRELLFTYVTLMEEAFPDVSCRVRIHRQLMLDHLELMLLCYEDVFVSMSEGAP